MGQGLIVCQQVNDTQYSSILWPSARLINVVQEQLEDPEFCALLDVLPEEIFQPYKNAHDKLLQKPNDIAND